MTRRYKIRISHAETHKLLLLLTKCCLTSMDINGILHVVVVLRKLAMPVAGGVPCVDSTFFMPVSERKYYMAKNFLTLKGGKILSFVSDEKYYAFEVKDVTDIIGLLPNLLPQV